MSNETVFLSGLPRSGSTILANVLAMHPKITATPSSPLCNMLQNLRKLWSDDPFLLSQLDSDFEDVHFRLKLATKSFIDSWSLSAKFLSEDKECDDSKYITIDKNRGWLFCAEWLREIYPNFKVIITLRDLISVYNSVEKQHRKTLFLDFPDHMEHNLVDGRANALFSDNGIVGGPIKGLQNIGDIPDISRHFYYWRYEDFINNPQETINTLFQFLEVEPCEIDFDNIIQSTQESDSYHRMKYPHFVNAKVEASSEPILVAPRIADEIKNRFAWYYQHFYADLISAPIQQSTNFPLDMESKVDVSVTQPAQQYQSPPAPQSYNSSTPKNSTLTSQEFQLANNLEQMIESEHQK